MDYHPIQGSSNTPSHFMLPRNRDTPRQSSCGRLAREDFTYVLLGISIA